MRKIKFRAILLSEKQWGIGSLILKKKNNGETYYDMVLLGKEGLDCHWCINQETIGQFTGLYDKNGKEIYVGDILKTNRGKLEWHYIITDSRSCDISDREQKEYYGVFKKTIYRNFGEKEDEIGEVNIVFKDCHLLENEQNYDLFIYVDGKDYEVIGNIHEGESL